MRGRRVSFVKIVIFFFERSLATLCDMETGIFLDEGNIGQSEDFNWLGILKVFLSDGDSEQVAVTEIVLVKPKHAIASADDIVRIPQSLFETVTQVMFISEGGIPVYLSPVSYVTHPEYEVTTFNTIAVIELNVGEDSPLIPICFPIVSYDSNYLYLTAFTDENKILEKMIYRIQYTEKQVCEEFYQREGLTDKSREPTSYICGRRASAREHCVWDSGMALVSNSSGWFTLVGFSIHGPGCVAPARFINLLHYFDWIDFVTRDKHANFDYFDNRRANELDVDVPIHRTFIANGSGIKTFPKGAIKRHDFVRWPFDMQTLKAFIVEPSSDDKDLLHIHPFSTEMEVDLNACKSTRVLLYQEYFEVTAPADNVGTVTYKLSMYDMVIRGCTCVTLKVNCNTRSDAILAFKEKFVFDSQEEPGTDAVVTSPPDVFKHYPITERGDTPSHSNPSLNPNLKPVFLTQPVTSLNVLNYDLYIKFDFNKSASLTFKMFGKFSDPAFKRSGRKGFKARTPKRKKMRHWGLSQAVVDKTVKEPTLEAEHEVVHDLTMTASRGSIEVPHILIVLGCSLIKYCFEEYFLYSLVLVTM